LTRIACPNLTGLPGGDRIPIYDNLSSVTTMAHVPITTAALRALRLLLEVYGLLMLLLIAVGPLIFGLSPYEGLLRLGAPGFYALVFGATVLWVAVVSMLWRTDSE
jgi:hypothetical protein